MLRIEELIEEFGKGVYALSMALGHLWTQSPNALQHINQLALGPIYIESGRMQHPNLPSGIYAPRIEFEMEFDRFGWLHETASKRWRMWAEVNAEEVVFSIAFQRPYENRAMDTYFEGKLSYNGTIESSVYRGELLPRHKETLLAWAEDFARAGKEAGSILVVEIAKRIRELALELPDPDPQEVEA